MGSPRVLTNSTNPFSHIQVWRISIGMGKHLKDRLLPCFLSFWLLQSHNLCPNSQHLHMEHCADPCATMHRFVTCSIMYSIIRGINRHAQMSSRHDANCVNSKPVAAMTMRTTRNQTSSVYGYIPQPSIPSPLRFSIPFSPHPLLSLQSQDLTPRLLLPRTPSPYLPPR